MPFRHHKTKQKFWGGGTPSPHPTLALRPPNLELVLTPLLRTYVLSEPAVAVQIMDVNRKRHTYMYATEQTTSVQTYCRVL